MLKFIIIFSRLVGFERFMRYEERMPYKYLCSDAKSYHFYNVAPQISYTDVIWNELDTLMRDVEY